MPPSTRTHGSSRRLRRRIHLVSSPGDTGSEWNEIDDDVTLSQAIPKPTLLERFDKNWNYDQLFDRLLELTTKWEKITALVALITTNLSGNKSLGALLEILARDRVAAQSSEDGSGAKFSTGGLNLGELLSMAESLLKQQASMGTVSPEPGQDSVKVEPVVEMEEEPQMAPSETPIVVDAEVLDEKKNPEEV